MQFRGWCRLTEFEMSCEQGKWHFQSICISLRFCQSVAGDVKFRKYANVSVFWHWLKRRFKGSEVRIQASSPCEQVVFRHGSVWLVAEVGQRLLDHVGALRAVLRRRRRRWLVARHPVLVDDVERSRRRRFRTRRIFRKFWNFAQADLADAGWDVVRRCRHHRLSFRNLKKKKSINGGLHSTVTALVLQAQPAQVWKKLGSENFFQCCRANW